LGVLSLILLLSGLLVMGWLVWRLIPAPQRPLAVDGPGPARLLLAPHEIPDRPELEEPARSELASLVARLDALVPSEGGAIDWYSYDHDEDPYDALDTGDRGLADGANELWLANRRGLLRFAVEHLKAVLAHADDRGRVRCADVDVRYLNGERGVERFILDESLAPPHPCEVQPSGPKPVEQKVAEGVATGAPVPVRKRMTA
jgi:hypothetical protein